MTAETQEQPAAAAAETTTGVATQAARLYEFSSWVHLGPDAENCEAIDEAAGTNECSNPLHFHGWCRLPNQFQHRDLRDRASAAKARKARQLRNEGTDAYEILETDLDALVKAGEEGRKAMVEELVARDWPTDYLEAVEEVRGKEPKGDGDPPYKHIERDQERYSELGRMKADERPQDEWDELEAHLTQYGKDIEEALKAAQDPKREALGAKDTPELVDMVRDQRIDRLSSEDFMDTYNLHMWQSMTLGAPGGEHKFPSVEAMHAAAPEVIEALGETYGSLEASERRSSGNS